MEDEGIQHRQRSPTSLEGRVKDRSNVTALSDSLGLKPGDLIVVTRGSYIKLSDVGGYKQIPVDRSDSPICQIKSTDIVVYLHHETCEYENSFSKQITSVSKTLVFVHGIVCWINSMFVRGVQCTKNDETMTQ